MIEIGSRAVVAMVLLAALLLAWFLAATLYLVMRDELVVSLATGQDRAQYTQEDRILELRARIDKITARQLLNQDSIEDRVASVVARQAELEARQVMVADLGARAEKAGLVTRASTDRAGALMPGDAIALPFAAPSTPASQRPRPLPDMPAATTSTPAPWGQRTFDRARGPMDGVVTEVERRASRMETGQVDLLQVIGESAEEEIANGRKVVASLGLDPARFGKGAMTPPPVRRLVPLDELMLRDVNPEAAQGSALGGPLLPPSGPRSGAERFEAGILRAEQTLESAQRTRAVMQALPLGRPMAERYDMTSGYGTRLDPFTRSPALHSGLDFRAPTGTPVRAVAAGKIIEAGPSGGYGRMVEIDHGFGITTRYAHLSSIAVSEGDKIEKGAVLGHVGSTGRSTGPHLHYEVRLDDDATDPMRFVRAQKLISNQ